MQCDNPIRIIDAGTTIKGKYYEDNVYAKCGQCYPCKITRVRGWIFRLKKEMEVSHTAYFLTLTYNNEFVPITKNGWMSLSNTKYIKENGKTKQESSDVQKYLKRLRILQSQNENFTKDRLPKISYYCTAEYGTKSKRPHYHLIIFNVLNENHLDEAWTKDGKSMGLVHFGKVNEASIAYTLEYICESKNKEYVPRDDRVPEYSIMSKGLGSNYLSEAVKKFHQQNWKDMYITIEDETKIALPKYYRDKIYKTLPELKEKQGLYIAKEVETQKFRDLDKYGEKHFDNKKIANAQKLSKLKTNRKI